MSNVQEKPFLTEFNTSIRRISELVQERQENGNRLIGVITENINAIDEKVNQLKSISESIADKFRQLRDELESSKALSIKQQRDIQECNDSYQQLTELKIKTQEELDELKRTSQEKIQGLQQEIDEKERRIQELTGQMAPLQQQIEELTRERDELKRQGEEKDIQIAGIAEKDRQIQQLTLELEGVGARIIELTAAVEAKDKQIEDLTTQNTSNTTRIQELERNLADITREEQRKTQELATIQAENDDLVSRIIEATRVINESMNLLDQLRGSKRNEDTQQLLKRFKTTSEMIQTISNALQGLNNSHGGGKIYKRKRKTRKIRKFKKFRGGFTYGTSSSFRNKRKKTNRITNKMSSKFTSSNSYKKIKN
jgi:chromosome segregation ATPase